MKLIDLSVTISPAIKEPLPLTIAYENHREGAKNMGPMLLSGLTGDDLFVGGNALAGEVITLTGHAGTHVDAPWHYFPTSEGKPARTIEHMPLDWFYHDAVVLDFTDKPDAYCFTIADVQEKLTVIAYTLKPFDIVLIRCDADKRMFESDYVRIHVGASAEATRWLIDQGIRVMGTDGWGWDPPLFTQIETYRRQPRAGIIWAAHYVGRDKEYCQIEKLANLDQLPPFGFKVACFPIKIEGGSAGWTRAVAFIDEP